MLLNEPGLFILACVSSALAALIVFFIAGGGRGE